MDIIPRKVGDISRFESNGRRFAIKRLNHDTWHLSADDMHRCRFGNRAEIAQDVAYASEFGTLPPRSGKSWA